MCAYYGVYRTIKICNFTSLFAKCKTKIKSSFIPRQGTTRSFSTTQFPIDQISNLKKDILLYTYERTKFLKYLSIFGIAQLGVWIFYGGFMFVSLRNISKSKMKSEEIFTKSSLWKSINLGDKKLRFVCTALCFGIGVLSAVVCCVLPSRIIKELILCKGGKIASVVTYGPFGRTSQREIPLKNLSCVTSRTQAKSYIAIKIKPKWFYYLIDCRGKFYQPTLFDYTIGTRTAKPY